MFGGYNSIYYEVIASQTSTNCNRLNWRDVVNVKYFCHITVVTTYTDRLSVIYTYMYSHCSLTAKLLKKNNMKKKAFNGY